MICFFRGDLSVASVTLIGIRYTETVSELQQQQHQYIVYSGHNNEIPVEVWKVETGNIAPRCITRRQQQQL